MNKHKRCNQNNKIRFSKLSYLNYNIYSAKLETLKIHKIVNFSSRTRVEHFFAGSFYKFRVYSLAGGSAIIS